MSLEERKDFLDWMRLADEYHISSWEAFDLRQLLQRLQELVRFDRNGFTINEIPEKRDVRFNVGQVTDDYGVEIYDPVPTCVKSAYYHGTQLVVKAGFWKEVEAFWAAHPEDVVIVALRGDNVTSGSMVCPSGPPSAHRWEVRAEIKFEEKDGDKIKNWRHKSFIHFHSNPDIKSEESQKWLRRLGVRLKTGKAWEPDQWVYEGILERAGIR